MDDKLAAMKDFCKKNGLCFCCGEKWSHRHKCPSQVSLHVIEELLDALEEIEQDQDSGDSSEVEEVVLAVGQETGSGPSKRRTMKI